MSNQLTLAIVHRKPSKTLGGLFPSPWRILTSTCDRCALALDWPPSAPTKELLTSDAVDVLHEAVSGSLRDIDRVAHDALRSSARRKRKLIERDVVQAGL